MTKNLYTIELLGGCWRVREVATGKLCTQTFRVYAHAQRLANDLTESAQAVAEIAETENEAIRLRAIKRLTARSYTWAKTVSEMQREQQEAA